MLGDKIKELLEKNNMTQKELAEKVGCTECAMSKYVSGDRTPKAMYIVNIAKVFGTTIEYLLEMEEEKIIPIRANEYQKLAMRTANEKCFNLANVGLGISGEAGEITDIIKKHLFHGHELSVEHLEKELGDVLWYVALCCAVIGTDMEKVMQINIDKLRKRYPNGFSEYDSIHRKDIA